MKKLTAFILSVLIIFTSCLSADALSSEKFSEQFTDDGLWKYTVYDNNNAEITGYLGKESNITIPDKINNYSVISIGSAAFYNSDIEKISFSSSIHSIGWWAFYGCKKLTSVELNEVLNTIEYGAFMNCHKLKEVSLPYTVYSIG